MLSDDYKKQLEQLHQATVPGGFNWGTSGYRYASQVAQHIKVHKCGDVLDYGSGRETLRIALEQLLPKVTVHCYDPGIPGRDKLPEPADMLTSTDVLEHIEPFYLDSVLAHMCGLARKAAYLAIATKPSKFFLPDGRNAHLIVEHAHWWLGQLSRYDWKIVRHFVGSKTFEVWIIK